MGQTDTWLLISGGVAASGITLEGYLGFSIGPEDTNLLFYFLFHDFLTATE